jgi:hypothetical protein
MSGSALCEGQAELKTIKNENQKKRYFSRKGTKAQRMNLCIACFLPLRLCAFA